MLSRFLRLSIAGTLAAALFSSPAFSQGKGHGKGKGHNKNEDDQGESSKYYFGERDREIITRYYSNRGSNLPPGLAKRGGSLPPGLEKHLSATARCRPDYKSASSRAPWSSNGNCRPFPQTTIVRCLVRTSSSLTKIRM